VIWVLKFLKSSLLLIMQGAGTSVPAHCLHQHRHGMLRSLPLEIYSALLLSRQLSMRCPVLLRTHLPPRSKVCFARSLLYRRADGEEAPLAIALPRELRFS